MSGAADTLPNEREIARTHAHWIVFARDGGAAALLGLAPLLMSPLFAGGIFSYVAGDYAALAPVLGYLWVLVAWIALAATWTNYRAGRLIITDRRVTYRIETALLSRAAKTWRMDRIEEVSADKRGFLQTTLNYGTVTIRTAGGASPDVLADMPDPERLRDAMFEGAASITALAAANERQEQLLHTISHEVKAHLTKDAAALASIAEGDYGQAPEQLRKMAGEALAETRKGVGMVTNLLHASDFKTGAVAFEARVFDLKAAVRDVVEGLRPDAARKRLSLECVAPEETYLVAGDGQKIRDHVIRNLLDNAIRYTPRGSVRAALARVDRFVVLTVADTGVGLSEGDLSRLFTEGGRGENSTAVNPSSTGYGLSIAKSVVEAHGGSIWAESGGRGAGSRFYACFPAARRSITRPEDV